MVLSLSIYRLNLLNITERYSLVVLVPQNNYLKIALAIAVRLSGTSPRGNLGRSKITYRGSVTGFQHPFERPKYIIEWRKICK